MPAAAELLDPCDARDPYDRFDRQVQRLLDLGVPAAAGSTPAALAGRLAPLRERVPTDGAAFVIVLTEALVPRHELPERVVLHGRAGFTSMEPDDVRRFVATVDVPNAAAYLAVGVSTGPEHLGRTPDQALPLIEAAGRSPLTLEEGLALALQQPELLRTSCCTSLLGSRCGDRRVTAVWVSKGRPRLGWCYAGAPHTWLGSGSLSSRRA